MLINVYVEHSSLQLNQLFTYACNESVFVGCRVRVDFGNREVIGFVVEVNVESDYENIKEIKEVIDERPLFNDELMALADYISLRYVSSYASVYKAMLPPALRPSVSHSKIIYEDIVYLGVSNLPLTNKQREVLDSINPLLPMKASLFRKTCKGISKPLIDKGYVILKKEPKKAVLPQFDLEDTNHCLTHEQKNAIKKIQEGTSLCYLLHGVTGSGKTEVFLHLASSVLAQGKQVLFLVPEIGLTPMMVQRVMARFGNSIAIYHSQLNAQEKYDQYCLVRDKKVNIVVGTRSAIFMPFDNLGLILMDEEHDTSYKQDNMPRYHTRDVALFRAKYHHCKLVLSSATPSLESYSRAYKDVYTLVELKNRISKQMPEIHLLDLKKEKTIYGLSHTLLVKIQETIDQHKQVILLLNRRGYLPVVRCADCNEVLLCPDCGIALSYHKATNSLQCHCCGNVYAFHHECPSCHGHNFYSSTLGTERLEENLQALFPTAHIVRMDADSTRRKNAHMKLLKEFEEKGDILVGTQMVAKGLDFPNVTLVGILQADNAMLHSDYRSCEMAYEMLEQASGRSGRSKNPGEVYIQTYDLEHYVMKSVVSHDYQAFFIREMKYRHMGGYPPYVFLCTIIYSHMDLEKALACANEEKEYVKLKTLGPIEIHMRQKNKRVRLIVKANSEQKLQDAIWDLVKYHQAKHANVKQDINMYPLILEE